MYIFDDGGRAEAGFRGSAGDCVTRALAIAESIPYQEAYDALNDALHHWLDTSRSREARAWKGPRTVRNGTPKAVFRGLLADRGWEWTPTMMIGSGCQVHLTASELPSGRLIVQVSKHVVAVKDGMIFDTHDPSREGTRCVYGYWQRS